MDVFEWPVDGSCGTLGRWMMVGFVGRSVRLYVSAMSCKPWLSCVHNSPIDTRCSIGRPFRSLQFYPQRTDPFDFVEEETSSRYTNFPLPQTCIEWSSVIFVRNVVVTEIIFQCSQRKEYDSVQKLQYMHARLALLIRKNNLL